MKHVAASDNKASPPRLPPLELDPVGDSGSGIPQWRLKEEEEDSAGLGRRNAVWAGLRVGVASRPKEGLKGEGCRKEAGDWSASAMEEDDEEVEEESKNLKKRRRRRKIYKKKMYKAIASPTPSSGWLQFGSQIKFVHDKLF